MNLTPLIFKKFWNSSATNCGPLSDTACSSKPSLIPRPFTRHAPLSPQHAHTTRKGLLYFTANDITDDTRKRAILLTVCGLTTYGLIHNLAALKKPAEVPYKDLGPLVKAHLTPRPTVMAARFHFHTRTQQSGETVATFVSKLRRLSEDCSLGKFLDEIMRDRLACRVANNAIQRCLLAEPGLTLKKGLDLARAMEMAEKDVKDMQTPRSEPRGGAETDVHQVRKRRDARRQTAGVSCHRCSGKHAMKDCRQKEATCYSCKKQGHLARACRSKKPPVNRGKGSSKRKNGVSHQSVHAINM